MFQDNLPTKQVAGSSLVSSSETSSVFCFLAAGCSSASSEEDLFSEEDSESESESEEESDEEEEEESEDSESDSEEQDSESDSFLESFLNFNYYYL